MAQKYGIFVLFVSILLLNLSCNNDTVNNYYSNESSGKIPTSIRNVTDNPQSILSFSELQVITRGTTMKLRVNRNDFEVWEVNVTFDAVYRSRNERLILCHTNDDFPVGSGDSGSPLLTSDGRIVGILCYGYFFNSTNFIARAIEDVIAIDTAAASVAPSSSFEKMIQPVYFVTGLSPEAAVRYPELGKILGQGSNAVRSLTAKQYFPEKMNGSLAVPGSSIAVNYITGDYVNEAAIGTMSYKKNENIFAFGHNYMTFLAAPTYIASTKSFIQTHAESFKMAEPSAEFIGSCTKNTANGILIKNNVSPLIADVKTQCTIDGTMMFSYNHKVANTPSIKYDMRMAADLSCYLIYKKIQELDKSSDSVKATCTVHVVTDKDTQDRTFSLNGTNIDWSIYYYLTSDSIRISTSSKEVKSYHLSVDLKY